MRKWLAWALLFCFSWGLAVTPVAADEPSSFGTIYSFADFEVAEVTLDTRWMATRELGLSHGARLFRNNVGPGHQGGSPTGPQ